MQRVRISLTTADARLPQLLATMPELQVLERGDAGALVELLADPEAAADLLATLVRAGMRISTFAPERQSLEQVYLGAAREVAR